MGNDDVDQVDQDENPSTSLFRSYLRIRTDHPNPDYASCINFLLGISDEIGGLENFVVGKPILVMTLKGQEPDLPSVLLNSHMDVVPAEQGCWSHDPFEAFKDENGDIYGRGTQDMKSVGVQYLEAVRRIKGQGRKLRRTVHISFMPDEEVGGADGMARFVLGENFSRLNVGLALDEGMASGEEERKVIVYYGQRNGFYVVFHCRGRTGHASLFVEDTAAEKLNRVLTRLLRFRDEQKLRLNVEGKTLGEVTTVNITSVSGGVARNVVPGHMTAGVDIRIAPNTDLVQFERMIRAWAEEAGSGGDDGGVDAEFVRKFTDQTLSSTDPSDPWFSALSRALAKHVEMECRVFPAGTDCRFLRQIGVPAYGFSPLSETPVLLHDVDERINEKVFLKGIDIYCDVIEQLANVP